MAKKSTLRVVEPGANHVSPMRELGRDGLAVWQQVLSEYDVSDAGGVQLLLIACESIDRAEACRKQIAEEGAVLRDKRGSVRDHPLIRHETAARALAARMLCKLGLDVEPVGRVGRPGRPFGYGLICRRTADQTIAAFLIAANIYGNFYGARRRGKRTH